MDNDEQEVLEFFESVGFTVKKIPESSEESPDFLIVDEESKVLVELKTKLDSESLINKRESKLEKGEMFEKSTVLKRTNTLSGIIRKASSQLASQKEKHDADFCFVYLQAMGIHSSEKLTQFEVSLFGSKDIILMGGGDPDIKTCYYFTHSDFFNNRQVLDGAFIFGENSGRLCINSLSPNYKRVIESKFVNRFWPGVLDPNEQESSGKAYILDADLPRSDDVALKEYLQEKYDLPKIVPFNWPHISVISRLPADGENEF